MGGGAGAFEDGPPLMVSEEGSVQAPFQVDEEVDAVDEAVGGVEATNKNHGGVLGGIVAAILTCMNAITMALSNVFDGQLNG
jgi:hypothetical protein